MSVAVAMVGGLTLMAGSTAATAIAATVDDHAQARQIAESGLELAIAYIERTPTWRAEMSEGVWVSGQGMLEGDVSIDAEFEDSAPDPSVEDPSFEETVDTLPVPLLNPPMAGTIGGWEVNRTAAVETGATVPLIGTRASASATDGSNEAFISFGASITGTGTFSQEVTATIGQSLSAELEPSHVYDLAVDITRSGFPPLDSSFGFRLYAGATLLVSTAESLTNFENLTPEEVEAQAEQLLSQAQEPSTLVENAQIGSTSEYALRFVSPEDPPSGPLRIELFAESIGIAASVAFDNVRLQTISNEPVWLTAAGRHGVASHDASAAIVSDIAGNIRVVAWAEP
jgi:hypothetical protein